MSNKFNENMSSREIEYLYLVELDKCKTKEDKKKLDEEFDPIYSKIHNRELNTPNERIKK